MKTKINHAKYSKKKLKNLRKLSTLKNGKVFKTLKGNIKFNPIRRRMYNVLKQTYSHIKIDSKYDENLKKMLNANVSQHVSYSTNLCVINININPVKKLYKFYIKRDNLPNDSRITAIFNTFTNLGKWLKTQDGWESLKQLTNGKPINTAIFIWISDRFIWDIPNIDRKLPICLYACPRDMNYIIIPDGTFFMQSTTKRYAGKGLNWEQQKQLFNSDISKKTNKFFFRGVDTTKKIHNIRGFIYDRLQHESDIEFKNNMIYEFLTGDNYESVAAFKKYKFMLNLPGHYPWSTRLKYLYLGRQFIINVRVFTYLADGTIEDHYHSFVDLIIPDSHCINIDMNYYYIDSKTEDANEKLKKDADAKNEAELERVYGQIKSIYYTYKNREPSKDKKVMSGYNLINQLTSADMYYYYLLIAVNNSKLGIKPVGLPNL